MTISIRKRLKKNWFGLCAFLILITAFTLRFYDYPNRIGLGVDQASFATLARYALLNFKLPLLGQFTSAAPFQAGGEWYWFLMFGQFLSPDSYIAQWAFLTFLHMLFVALIIFVGRYLVSPKFGLLAGFLAAISPSQIQHSLNLINQAPIAFIGLISLFFALKYHKEKKGAHAFMLGLFSGLAPAFHPQGFALLFLCLTTLLFSGRPKFRNLFFLALGLITPWIPVFIADSGNNFMNTRNMVQYYLHDQYKISLDVLGRRWLTFGLDFIPRSWAYVIGGKNILMGYVILVPLGLFFVYDLIKKKISKEWLIIFITLGLMFLLLRYARVPLYDSYLITLHPFILLASSWVVYRIYKVFPAAFFGLLLLLTLGSLSIVKDEIVYRTTKPHIDSTVETLQAALIKKYPGQEFALYDYQRKSVDVTQTLTFYLYADNLIRDDGMKIGVTNSISQEELNIHKPIYVERGYQLFNLSSSSSASLKKAGWDFLNPSAVYKNVQEWFK